MCCSVCSARNVALASSSVATSTSAVVFWMLPTKPLASGLSFWYMHCLRRPLSLSAERFTSSALWTSLYFVLAVRWLASSSHFRRSGTTLICYLICPGRRDVLVSRHRHAGGLALKMRLSRLAVALSSEILMGWPVFRSEKTAEGRPMSSWLRRPGMQPGWTQWMAAAFGSGQG